ncbi:MAG: LysM peptidoglycan-binding domain-containing protein, partial [Anaerolineales bacterium]
MSLLERIVRRLLPSIIVLVASAVLVMLALSLPSSQVAAQEGTEERPVYVVQEGDALWDIAARFGVSLDELVQLNGIADPNQVPAGTRLFIPGLEGIAGELVTQRMPFGESLQSISRRYKISEQLLARLNHISSPDELYAGYSLVLPQSNQVITEAKRTAIAPGQSLLELSVLHGANPWQVVGDNDLQGSWQALPGDVLLLSSDSESGPGGLPGDIAAVEISRLPLQQGKTTEIKLSGAEGLSLGGEILGHPLHFFKESSSTYVALQGVHAMQETGLYPLTLSGSLGDGTPFTYTQKVLVQAVDYPYDQPL